MGPQTPDQIPGDKKPRKERKKLRETTRVVSVQFPSCCFTSSHCPTDASKTGFIWIFLQLPLHSLLTHSLFTLFRFCSVYASYSSYFVWNSTSLLSSMPSLPPFALVIQEPAWISCLCITRFFPRKKELQQHVIMTHWNTQSIQLSIYFRPCNQASVIRESC